MVYIYTMSGEMRANIPHFMKKARFNPRRSTILLQNVIIKIHIPIAQKYSGRYNGDMEGCPWISGN